MLNKWNEVNGDIFGSNKEQVSPWLDDFRESKISYLQVALTIKHQIFWFQVSVRNVKLSMQILKRQNDFSLQQKKH